MKKYLFTGFVTLLPIALTLIITLWVFDLLTAPLTGITESMIIRFEQNLGISVDQHRTLVVILSRISALILLIVIILTLGILGQKFLYHFFLKIVDKVFSKIPIIRTIYRLSHDVTRAVFSENKKTFKEAVLVPFPHQDALSLGFVMGKTPDIFKKAGIPLTDFAVFVPTAPHPLSGFLLLTPKKLAIPLDVSIEEAFKFLLSCGVIHPKENIKSQDAPPPPADL